MNNKKIVLTTILLFLLLVHSRISGAFEVAVMKSADIKPYSEAIEGFQSSCGCNTTEIDYQETGDGETRSMVTGLKADAVLAVGMDALRHAQLIKHIPVIYSMVPSSPLAPSHQGNISGVSMYISPEKFISAITDLFPNVKRVGAVYDPYNNEAFAKEAARVAGEKGIELVLKTVTRPADVPALIDAMKGRIDVYWMLPDATVVRPEVVNYLLLFSFQNKVPVFAFSKKYVEMGAMAGISVSPFDIGVQAGEIARHLHIERNAAPVRVNPIKTVLMINGKVAKKLGLSISEEIKGRAEDVR